MTDPIHLAVLLTQAIDALRIQPGYWYLDATFGRGGHTRKILLAGGKVLALDFDHQAIDWGTRHFASQIAEKKLILVRENFDQLGKIAKKLRGENKISEIKGVLFDFGTSSEQLTSTDRGLSFSGDDQQLDMRLDQRLGVKAKDLLAVLSEKQLRKIFAEYGGEKDARKIAKKIVNERKSGEQINTISQLVKIIESSKKERRRGIRHSATKVFQALRIAVNDELDNIRRALPTALDVVENSGRIVTISFHEGEDRIVKNKFKKWEQEKKGKVITKKPIKPNETEINNNPRSRSAKMRVFARE